MIGKGRFVSLRTRNKTEQRILFYKEYSLTHNLKYKWDPYIVNKCTGELKFYVICISLPVCVRIIKPRRKGLFSLSFPLPCFVTGMIYKKKLTGMGLP